MNDLNEEVNYSISCSQIRPVCEGQAVVEDMVHNSDTGDGQDAMVT